MNEELVVKLASDSFVSQFRGPSNLHEDATNDNANCGPACLAMLAKIFGCRELDALNANDLIEEMRTLATGDLSEYSCTTMPELNSALIHLGLPLVRLPGNFKKAGRFCFGLTTDTS